MNPGMSPITGKANSKPHSKTTPQERSLARDALIRLAVALLRPVVRMLLRYNLSYPEMNQICRWLYVDVAMREREFFIPRRRKQFKARVACLTGLSRKEVLRLYQTPAPELNDQLESCNRAARVLAGWLSDPGFQDKDGRPRDLDFRGDRHDQNQGKKQDKDKDFAELVQAYSGDIPPRAVLDELLQSGNCEMDKAGHIRILDPVYVTRPIAPAALLLAAERGASLMNEIDETLRTTALPRTAVRETPQASEQVESVSEKAIATA